MTEDAAGLRRDLLDARRFLLALVADLEGEQWIGPELDEVNPPLWEIGHVGWFLERFVLRDGLGREPLRRNGDVVYDSSVIEHWSRWQTVLPSLARTLSYLEEVDEALLEVLDRGVDGRVAHRLRLGILHEDMHCEALLYSRQTLGLPAPLLAGSAEPATGGPCRGDVAFDGGPMELGSRRGAQFVFDNEKWAHEVVLRPFALARAPVTEGEFATFVEDGGYSRDELWTGAGRAWRERSGARAPVYWRTDGPEVLVREYDTWRPLKAHRAMLHVNAHEAEAWCRWAGRRLPTEAEWEFAACSGRCGGDKPRWPWSADDAAAGPSAAANLDFGALAAAEVGAFAPGDTVHGLRQMFGNVWEWTASPFAPYPGFAPDVYRDYSAPWFHSRRVLRGGSFATRSRLLRTTHRNFFTPDRRDVFAGFRTAALA